MPAHAPSRLRRAALGIKVLRGQAGARCFADMAFLRTRLLVGFQHCLREWGTSAVGDRGGEEILGGCSQSGG